MPRVWPPSEEQESRRVRERQKTRGNAKDGKKESAPRRRSRDEIADAEAEVARREARVAELTTMLADPELYNSGSGGKKRRRSVRSSSGRRRSSSRRSRRGSARSRRSS